MSMSESLSSPNMDRIQQALDGLLSPNEWEQFQTDVVADEALRAEYVDQAWLHANLRAGRESLVDLLDQDEPTALPLPDNVIAMPTKRRWSPIIWSAAAAAALTLTGSFFTFGNGDHTPAAPKTVATLIEAENCKWAGSDLPTSVDSKLGTGKLALVEGIATLKFESGAVVTMEAPTTLEVLTAMHCRLVEGTVTAEVPEPAHGFVIDTPDIKVVDLGTKFGVTAGSAGNSQVRVFEGEVEIEGLPEGGKKLLTEGKGLHVKSGATALGQEPIHGKQVQEEGGWLAIPTSFGKGKDGYVRRGDNGAPLGTQPLIIVKHSELPPSFKNERRAVISFDISQLKLPDVMEAQIVLDPEPSGFGFSSMVPDSRFAVYGVMDQDLDTWDEKGMLWDTFPGCNEAGPQPDKLKKLAEFWIPRGGSGGPLTVRGDTLLEFLRQDQNGLASFVIVRETGETDSSGLAHAFASKEHPTGRPPTLRARLKE